MKKVYCKSTHESFTDYNKYLKSKHWKLILKEFKKTHEKKCLLCENTSNLQLHHKTYRRMGKENMDDLVFLCSYCHNEVHKGLKISKELDDIIHFAEKEEKRLALNKRRRDRTKLRRKNKEDRKNAKIEMKRLNEIRTIAAGGRVRSQNIRALK